jgi:DNA-binding NtrC family response regulator
VRHSILVVDDNPGITVPMTEYMERAGFVVQVAQNAAEAKKCVDRRSFSLVITDLRMDSGRDEDGLDFVRHIRQHKPGLPVFILTASGSVETASESVRLQVDRFLGKPISMSKLLMEVREFVGEFYGAVQ